MFLDASHPASSDAKICMPKAMILQDQNPSSNIVSPLYRRVPDWHGVKTRMGRRVLRHVHHICGSWGAKHPRLMAVWMCAWVVVSSPTTTHTKKKKM